MAILVTGGAGYIGSATVEQLRNSGQDVVVIDNLVHGHRQAIGSEVPLYVGCVGDKDLVDRVISEHGVDSCVHFAAFAYVGESVTEPAKYFENNTVQTLGLLNSLITHNVKRFVFSSTCATYGEPKYVPIDETHPQQPVNPYGWTKFMIERILEAYDLAYDLKFASLRYFNAAGATVKCGEIHVPETHLIPNILRAAAGEIPSVSIFGSDYPTPDGTCIRDYIHISDLADAHLRALNYLISGKSLSVNLGNGLGFSVLEVIESARRVTGRQIEVEFKPRRPGDPDRLIANASKAAELLDWKPDHTSIESIIESAWVWKLRHQGEYLRH